MVTKREKAIAIPKHLWNQAKIRNNDINRTVQNGSDKFEQFNDFSAEIYDELYSSFPADVTENDDNKWACNFIEQMKTTDKENEGDYSGFEGLRKRTEGNELWSEIASQSFLNGFVDSATHQGTLSDTQDDKDVQEYLERLKQQIQDQPKISKEDQEIIKNLEQQIQDRNQVIKDKQNQHKEYDDNVNNVAIRQAIRQAVDKANQDIKEVKQAIDAFSFGDNPHSGGKQTSEIGKKLSKYVKNSDKIKKIMELLGRMKRTADNEIKNKPKKGTDEIVGIELGSDLARVLPSQLMYLADDLLENVFLKRFSNHELLQYELSEEPPKNHGPIICCVDSSGSMDGDRIQWAMACALTFLHIATKQKRDFQIIHFGYDVVRIDTFLKEESVDLDKVMNTIDFFNSSGGTQFDPPIRQAIQTLADSQNFENADIVFLTDGQARISAEIKEQVITGSKEAGLKFYSILIDSTSDESLKEISTEVIHLNDALKDSAKINTLFSKV